MSCAATPGPILRQHRRPRSSAMGKIVSNFFISMDGVVEAPHEWHFPYFDEQMGKVVESGMETAGAFLLGHRLYDEWSHYWTTEGDGDFADFINTLPKYVIAHED